MVFLASQASHLFVTVSWLALPRALRSTLVYLKFSPPFVVFLASEAAAGLIPPCCPSALSHILHRFVACAAQSFAIYPSLLLLFECRMILLERLDLAFFAQAGAYLTSIPRRGGLEKSRNWFFIPSIGFHGNALQTCMVSAWFALWLLSVSL